MYMKKAPAHKVTTPASENSRWNEKVEASRPTLGHVVPGEYKEAQKRVGKRQRASVEGARGSTKNRIRAQGKLRDDFKNNPANLRILGGTARGRKLDSPDVYLRPMMGKVREALFSTLYSFGVYDAASLDAASTSVTTKCRHLDVFAGSGSVGLESLSRGATGAVFVDFAQNCCDVIASNVEKCGFEGLGQPVCCDALLALRDPASVGIEGTFQVITITPPYEEVVYSELMEAVANSPLLDEDTVVVVEYPVELGCLPHSVENGKLIGIRNRKYGRTVVAIYVHRPSGRLRHTAESRPEEFVSL
eukprot:CAMPEP_0196803006 /NCGR_PEP_ID=MMETSP1362-20130617/2476_1 /TAXON_ID=163516 /ORGANISM="Leptocylindrus danicus, Strain CCMP1856" /LENGTH=303 /DNA_ID=CAMNT_0042174427 /DNA_START=135 /DNA_END=1046 /DNA_ORIENTATION=+